MSNDKHEKLARELYQGVPLGRSVHGEMVSWDKLDEGLKARWIEYARNAINIVEKHQERYGDE